MWLGGGEVPKDAQSYYVALAELYTIIRLWGHKLQVHTLSSRGGCGPRTCERWERDSHRVRVQSELGAQWTLFKLVPTSCCSLLVCTVFVFQDQNKTKMSEIDASAMVFCSYLFCPSFFFFGSGLDRHQRHQPKMLLVQRDFARPDRGTGTTSKVRCIGTRVDPNPKSLADRGCPAVRVACLDTGNEKSV